MGRDRGTHRPTTPSILSREFSPMPEQVQLPPALSFFPTTTSSTGSIPLPLVPAIGAIRNDNDAPDAL
ncbi:hypothetical protein CCMSSC00406_0010148 [Pleurotus cornucopiae]|uniref:Uncharacterized protein n=1 Tax=Pleurotus cornucopiae TaxID=5321 RepID=A0ACB7IT59_PLECO|nr:hypothetical protein CCMSSC00406_0010148 [Pleurotus cornucopiae]